MTSLKQEIFPEIDMDMVTIEVMYKGASPDEIESSIVQKIEEAIVGVDGVRELTGIASENIGIVKAEVDYGEDVNLIKDDIQTEIDRLTTLPENSEKPVIKIDSRSSEVIQLAVSGNLDEITHTKIIKKIKDDLTALPQITQVGLSGVKDYELKIEVSQDQLDEFGLTISQISAAIRRGSLDLPTGKLETVNGDILLRTKAQGQSKEEYEEIIVKTSPTGNTVKIKDIAKVYDGFEDSDLYSQFDSKPAKLLTIYRTGEQGAIEVAEAVKNYIDDNKKNMPAGVSIDYWQDNSVLLRDRIDLLVRNAILGLILVVISLTLFLDVRLAFWVSMGIIISFMGSFIVMKMTGTSINMISLFGFIIVLGIVVDDAIVVSENIMTHRTNGEPPMKSAKVGAGNVSTPVVYAVLTTVAAFSPLAFVEGMMGKVMGVIPVVVISVLMFSLYESLLILPSHLSHLQIVHPNRFVEFFGKLSHLVDKKLAFFINERFTPFLQKALRNRYTTIAISLFVLMFTIGMFRAGFIKFNFFPNIEADNIVVTLEMPVGSSFEQTMEVINEVEKAAKNVEKEFKGKTKKNEVFKHIYSIIGEQPSKKRGPAATSSTLNPAVAEINVELVGPEERNFSTTSVMNRWREAVGDVAGVKSLIFQSSLMSAGDDISIQLSSPDTDELDKSVSWVKNLLAEYSGVKDIKDNLDEGKLELKFTLKEAGNTLGLTVADLANQVRQGFYGEEVMKIQRGRDEVTIAVRFPKEERNSLGDIEDMLIRTPAGGMVPFTDIAKVKYGRGYSTINRLDRARIITVSADVDETIANPNEINSEVMLKIQQKVKKDYPGVKITKGGAQKEQKRSMMSLVKGFIIAVFVIYMLLAIPFKSYTQPMIVMTAIPFGIVGAVIGHLLMGYQISFISALGIVALSGVVVNDSLVLVDYMNIQHREKGLPMWDAVIIAAQRRFRPIMLTSLTTFLGLMPMILERSLQARFLVPMAISLGFGIIFATGITLIFVPCSAMIMDDIQKMRKKEVALEK
jgi:multidrug efflux pump subunit AcrB